MPEIITKKDAQYALDIVKAICTKVGPGLPGSSQEWERAAMIQKELESHLGTDNVAVEEFTLAPGAFLNPYPALFLLIAALLNICMGRFMGVSPWLTAVPALVFSIIAPLLFCLEFFFGFELIDPLFKKKRSANVVGRLRNPGTRNVKRLLILSGHHDSAPENTWLRFLGEVKRFFLRSHPDPALENTWLLILGYAFMAASATFFIGFIVMLVGCILQLTGVMTGNASVIRAGTLGLALLAYPILPAIIFGLFSFRGKNNGGNVPGAADNLSACALAVAMCRFLVENPAYIPPDTEIRFISFGSEEAGLRGSRRYVEHHLDELKNLDARLLNFETVAYPEIGILTSDLNGAVKNSPEMVESAAAAAERAGLPYKVTAASLGVGTDAAPFSRAGLKAVTLLPFKVPQQLVDFYHQKWDRPEILTIEPLLNVLKLTLEWIRCSGEQSEPPGPGGRKLSTGD